MVARRAVAAALEQSGYSGYAAHILEEDLAPEMAVYAFGGSPAPLIGAAPWPC